MLGFWGYSPHRITQLKGHLPEASRLLDGKMKKRKGLAAETGLFSRRANDLKPRQEKRIFEANFKFLNMRVTPRLTRRARPRRPSGRPARSRADRLGSYRLGPRP
jgi:hypothetical protein